MKIIVLNQKGGVGKSTITTNLGYGLALAGKRTLIIDIDPQAHSSVIYTPVLPQKKTVGDLFRAKETEIRDLIKQAEIVTEENGDEKIVAIQNLFILPSNIHLASTAENVISRLHREKILHNHIKKIEKDFDFILIDCPPNLGVLTINAIYTSDFILIPTSYSKYSLDGIADLFNSIEAVKESDKYDYKILRNIKDTRNKKTNEVIEEQLDQFNGNLFKTVIRKSESINQAQFVNLPIFVFDPASIGSEDFTSLTKEISQYA